jgi:hypothetical protein
MTAQMQRSTPVIVAPQSAEPGLPLCPADVFAELDKLIVGLGI